VLRVRESLAIARQTFDLDEPAPQALAAAALKRVGASADLREGVQAFIEKREPRWTGQ
jgi:enoyl-CoA hydratase